MIDVADERGTPRIVKDTTIFIELRSGLLLDNSDSVIVLCRSLDLSATGVQVLLDQSIPQGNLMRLCLDIKGHQLIFVVAQVVWQRESQASGEFNVGFKLLESRGTDYHAWSETVDEMFAL